MTNSAAKKGIMKYLAVPPTLRRSAWYCSFDIFCLSSPCLGFFPREYLALSIKSLSSLLLVCAKSMASVNCERKPCFFSLHLTTSKAACSLDFPFCSEKHMLDAMYQSLLKRSRDALLLVALLALFRGASVDTHCRRS